jgi:membrane-associated phospholipid phosphatase
MFFDPELTNVFRDALPGFGPFFMVITELGSETFYVALILIGFWAFKKKESVTTAYILLISVVMNYWIKLGIANERPPESYRYEGIEATNYSTPSGHSQNSATLFGWFTAKMKTWWILVISITLTFLIGLSRIYLGVHYLEDVLLGWTIGILTVVFLVVAEKPLTSFFSQIKEDYLYLLLFLFGFIATLVSTYILPLPPSDNFGSLGGLIMGLAIALPLEKRYVNFSVEALGDRKWRLALRIILGLILVLGVMLGLSPFLPTSEVWLRAVRYMLVVVIGVFLWPLIFTKLKL